MPSRGALPPGPREPGFVQGVRWLFEPTQLLERCARRHGDVFTLRLPGSGNDPLVVFHHPEHVRAIVTAPAGEVRAGEAKSSRRPFMGETSLVVIDGERHRRQRRLLAPPFAGERMRGYGERIREIADDVIDTWPTGRTIALQESLQRITLEVILQTIVGIEDPERRSLYRERIIRSSHLATRPLLMLPLFQTERLPGSPWRTFTRSMREIDALIHEDVRRARERGPDGRDDVLSMLLRARDAEGRPMSETELRDQMRTLLGSGNDTTATTLAWAFHFLLSRPDLLPRLREEVAEVTGGGPLRPDRADDLVSAVLNEAMRLRPIVPILPRRLGVPMTIGGVALPAGVFVAACPHLTHRRADVHPRPERFEPRRFLGIKPDPFAFLPFGAGVRLCIGRAFAMVEMKIVLARMLARLDLRPAPGAPVRAVRRLSTIAPSRGMPVIVERVRPRDA